MAKFPTFKVSWSLPRPWIGSYCTPSCITHRPVPTYWNRTNFLWTDGRTDGHFSTHVIRSTRRSGPKYTKRRSCDGWYVPRACWERRVRRWVSVESDPCWLAWTPRTSGPTHQSASIHPVLITRPSVRPNTRTEMYAGRVEYAPRDRQTDGRTDSRPKHYAFR